MKEGRRRPPFRIAWPRQFIVFPWPKEERASRRCLGGGDVFALVMEEKMRNRLSAIAHNENWGGGRSVEEEKKGGKETRLS